MDNFSETIKIESTGSDVIEFNLAEEEQEMEIIETGSIFTPTPSSSRKKQERGVRKWAGTATGTVRSRVEILPNDDPRVVRAGKGSTVSFVIKNFLLLVRDRIERTLKTFSSSRRHQSAALE